MLNETKTLIESISSYQLDTQNVPIELVLVLQGLICQIEQAHSNVVFIDENNKVIDKDVRKFLLSGLTNIDYIISEYYDKK